MNEYKILENINLKKYNSYGIGGLAKYLIEPNSIKKLQILIDYLENNNIKWYILGDGTNIIFPDQDFEGVIIKLDLINDFSVNGNQVYVGSGLKLNVFVKKMLDLGYVNYAALFGIPGTVGGAVVGNAGAFKKNLFDDLISVTVLHRNGLIETINKSNISYQYRNTEFKNSDKIILGATFKGIKGNVLEAQKMIKENLAKRKNTQPLEYKNAGSVFKNPEDYAAGYLIEKAGLKGTKIGDACVSEKHANFIINLGNAKSSDIMELIDLIKKKVLENMKIELVLEQVVVKW